MLDDLRAEQPAQRLVGQRFQKREQVPLHNVEALFLAQEILIESQFDASGTDVVIPQQFEKLATSASDVDDVLAAAEIFQVLPLAASDVSFLATIKIFECEVIKFLFTLDFRGEHWGSRGLVVVSPCRSMLQGVK